MYKGKRNWATMRGIVRRCDDANDVFVNGRLSMNPDVQRCMLQRWIWSVKRSYRTQLANSLLYNISKTKQLMDEISNLHMGCID